MTHKIRPQNSHFDAEFRRTILSDVADKTLGLDYVRILDEASEKIRSLDIPHSEKMAAAKALRTDIGGLTRGEIRLGRRGEMYRDTIDASHNPVPSVLIGALPKKLSDFLTGFYPESLKQSPQRLVGLIAASYALDRAVMDFQPSNPAESPVTKIPNIDELSKKMVLVVGATSVGKDAVRTGLVKDLHPELRIDQKMDRDDLIRRAAEIGVHMPVKLTGRNARPNEVEGADYFFFDGLSGRPNETKLASISQGREHLPYSYQYSGHMYGFALEDIPSGVSGKKDVIPGLREKLEDPNIRMILCGGGTTPEALHFKSVFPQATVIYLLATPEEQKLLRMEREVCSRWWGRGIGEITSTVMTGVEKLETAIRDAGASGSTSILTRILDSDEVRKMHDAFPDDTTSFAAGYEERLRDRLLEVMPQVGQALMMGPKKGFTIVPNERGRIEVAVGTIRNVLKHKGVIEESP